MNGVRESAPLHALRSPRRRLSLRVGSFLLAMCVSGAAAAVAVLLAPAGTASAASPPAATRTVLGRWPDPVSDERLAVLERAARGDDASAAALDDLARAYGSRRQWRQSLAAAERAVERDPKLVAARVTVAGAYLNSDRARQAVEAGREAVRVGPEDPAGYYILGWANHKLARFEEAVAALETCVRLDPSDPWAHYSLAVAYTGAQNFQLTEKQLDAALALDPPADLAKKARSTREQIRNVSSVVLQAYRANVDKDPDDASKQRLLAAACLQFGYDAEALAAADRAIALLRADAPGAGASGGGAAGGGAAGGSEGGDESADRAVTDLAEALRVRGTVLQRAGRWDDAAAALVEAAVLAPSDARVYRTLGRVRLAQGRAADAIPLLEKAVQLAPAARPSRLALIAAYEAIGKDDLAERERERLDEL